MLESNNTGIVLQRLTAGILYQPVNLERQALANFYAQASTTFDFGVFNLLPDGGRMAVGQDDLIIQPTRTQVNMAIPAPFEAVAQRAMAQFDAVRQFLRLQQFNAFGVKLIGVFPLGEPSPDYLENRLIRRDNPLDRLGLGRVGTGFRFHFEREGIWDVRIEPLFSDLSQIFVDVDAQKTEPFRDLRDAHTWMEGVERYIQREVVDFLRNLPA
ncbi:MAG: hypothetical protein GYA63_07535 [Armatimonadetes bacterium]|jgi:hypothetical protein|nr:hypothetical protein [Armatimonadota bacterium]HOC32065.1 hypothetical protein [Armatimonadota bacterium]